MKGTMIVLRVDGLEERTGYDASPELEELQASVDCHVPSPSKPASRITGTLTLRF